MQKAAEMIRAGKTSGLHAIAIECLKRCRVMITEWFAGIIKLVFRVGRGTDLAAWYLHFSAVEGRGEENKFSN